jgi:hypothetical protein
VDKRHSGLTRPYSLLNGYGLDGDSVQLTRWTGFKCALFISVLVVR